MPEVKEVGEDVLGDHFGMADQETQTAYINQDAGLPGEAENAVEVHELTHLADPEKKPFWREVNANWAAFKAEPIGWIIALAMTVFSWKRWRLYFRRIKEGK